MIVDSSARAARARIFTIFTDVSARCGMAALALLALALALGVPQLAAAQTPHFDPIEWPNSRALGTAAAAMTADGTAVGGSDGTGNVQGGFAWNSSGTMTNPCASFNSNTYSCGITGVNGSNGFWLAGTQVNNTGGTSIIYWESTFGPYSPPCPDGAATGCQAGQVSGVGNFVVNGSGPPANDPNGYGYGWIAVANQNNDSFVGPFVPANFQTSGISALSSDASWAAGNAQIRNTNASTAWYAYNGTGAICNLDPSGTHGAVVQGMTDTATNGVSPLIVGNAVDVTAGFNGPAIWNQISQQHCTGTLNFLGNIAGGYAPAGGGSANAVSADNNVIVGNVNRPTGGGAFRWTCNNGMESIEQLLVDSGAGFRDLSRLNDAVAISDNGVVIAGNGTDSSNNLPRAWRAVLPLPAAPTFTVSPASNLVLSGPKGGPFTATAQYQLSRSTGGQNLYVISGLPAWLTVDDGADGMTGSAAKTVKFSINASGAASLANGTYQATITITFGNGYISKGSAPTCTLGSQTLPVTLTIGPTHSHDFNADGRSDILWRDTSGDTTQWFMAAGGGIQSGESLGNIPTAWSVAGLRDFNGDGTADILWRDSSGDTTIWFIKNGGVISSTSLGNIPTAWSVDGTGDFNGDGTGDILWHDISGDTTIWLMKNGSILTTYSLGTIPTIWSIAGTGDFNGDGTTDILWHDAYGDVTIWIMSAGSIAQGISVGNLPTNWSIVGTGDFNGDGISDILWRNTAGDVLIWLMNANGSIKQQEVTGNVLTQWSVMETGDFNGDGKSDIAWIDTSGNVMTWLMNGFTPAAIPLGNVGTAWSIAGANAD